MTSISKPRQSILSLFDPLTLAEPSTPPRNASPSADSDKENENPPKNPLTLSTFFNRTYKPIHPLPKPLRRRLIDVGDVTVDDVDPWDSDEESGGDDLDMNDFEDNENDTLTFRQMAEAATPKFNSNRSSTVKASSPSVLRTPLSELTFCHETTPLARNRTLRNLTPSVRSKLNEVQSPEIVISAPSPQRRSARYVDEPEHHNPLAPFHEDELGTRFSSDAAANPLLNSVSSINLPSSSITGSLITETVIPSVFTPSASVASVSEGPIPNTFDNVRLRPNPPSTSSLDQSRCSVDLQTSFQLHFNDDMQFDLLNDKVSFFSGSKNGNSSYMDEETSFDSSFGDVTPSDLEEVAKTPSATRETFDIPKTGPEPKQEFIGRVDSATDRSNENHAVLVPGPSRGRSSSVISEDSRPTETVTPNRRRAATQGVPPPVLGLRIVKRSHLATQKPIVPRAIASPGRLVPRQSIAELHKAPSRSNARNQDEPQPDSSHRAGVPFQSTTNSSRPRIAAIDAKKAAPPRGISNAPTIPVGRDGPRRILVLDEHEGKSTSIPTTKTLSGGNTASSYGGPRRIMPIGEPASQTAKGPAPGTGLKQPSSTRGVAKALSRTSAGSSLPQPIPRTSRLPAPSAIGVRPSGLPARDHTIRGLPTIRRA